MFYLPQVNIGVNIASLIGLLQIIFGLFYLVFAIVKLMRIGIGLNNLAITLYIIQLVIMPIFLLLSGMILVLQGWRLDPILQFQQMILFFLVTLLSLKDILINTVDRNR